MPVALLTQSQFLIGIGEETQFADAFQDCKLAAGARQGRAAAEASDLARGMGETFQVLLMSRGVAREKAAALSGLKLAR